MKPKVSVIVPYYKHERFIEDCIVSILNQDFKDFELIVIDDGSPDDGYKIIEKYAKKHGFQFIRKENEGVCATLNLGLSLAKGEFFCAIASDDLMLKDRLSKQVRFIEENNLDCISARSKAFSDIDSLDVEDLLSTEVENFSGCRKFNFKNIVLYNYDIPALNLMWRRDILMMLGGYSLDTKLEDLDSLLKFTSKGYDVYVMNDICSLYRVHGGNTSSNRVLIAKERIRVLEGYKDMYPSLVELGINMSGFIISYKRKDVFKAGKMFVKTFFTRYIVSSMVFYGRLIWSRVNGVVGYDND